ncbi:MAG: TM2 domain-containing protein [Tidjanibacter sp.]|nr:TM2 domain-containing protein [Tidjanibacter sp.]
MKKLVLTLAVTLMAVCASANNYVANDLAIDALVENSIEMVVETAAPAAADMISLSSSKNPVVATALSVIPVTNWLAIHRYYLGTKAWMGLAYALTGSGFGILYVVDSVVLVLDLVQNNKISSKYVNNGKVIMWANLF